MELERWLPGGRRCDSNDIVWLMVGECLLYDAIKSKDRLGYVITNANCDHEESQKLETEEFACCNALQDASRHDLEMRRDKCITGRTLHIRWRMRYLLGEELYRSQRKFRLLNCSAARSTNNFSHYLPSFQCETTRRTPR